MGSLAPRLYLVTGGAGFVGSALVRRLVRDGYRVRVLDNQSRGSTTRLRDLGDDVEFIEADVRDPEAVHRATKGVDGICHLAFINGTEFFYTKPELVLDVGVKGIVNVLDACQAHRVGELVLVSTSEPRIEVLRRNDRGVWELHEARAGERLELAALGVTLDVDAVFEDPLKKA